MEQQVGKQCRKHKFRYDYRKITALLNRTTKVKHKFVQRAVQKYGWQCRVKRKKDSEQGNLARLKKM
ncbi:IS3 family transposase [Priestia megaterium]|uniref:IS3 family transposase n=1 Tax=Priestia megaterium TaxID=1404 RepID=UPI0039FD0527